MERVPVRNKTLILLTRRELGAYGSALMIPLPVFLFFIPDILERVSELVGNLGGETV